MATSRSSSIPPPSTQDYLRSFGFVIGPHLGSGATATVHAARHPAFGPVALKIGRHRAAGPALRHERSMLGRVSHAGIPEAHLYLDGDEYPVLVMSRLHGAIPTKRRSPRDAVSLALSLLAILDHVHRRGIVHCDLKRHNVLVGRRAQLLDFGVARNIGEHSTDTLGRVAGTPAYMAPEVLTGGIVDERTDLYSLGVLLYFSVSGRFPFPTEKGLHLSAKRKMSWIPPSLIRSDVPLEIDVILKRMLHPRRSHRTGADEVREQLRNLLPELSDRPPQTFGDLRDSGTTDRLAH